ncbi:hypothetical protein GUG51_04015, partial [Xanthomonas citri pv. citri]|nr:hypothetical protein [Xanthomonas citri pv. citri]
MHLIPIRGNSKLAITTALLKGCSELLAFCEFDEHLQESDPKDGNEHQEPWRAVRMARRTGRPVAVKVLRSTEDSSGKTREL